jgi:hypothetical protein
MIEWFKGMVRYAKLPFLLVELPLLIFVAITDVEGQLTAREAASRFLNGCGS